MQIYLQKKLVDYAGKRICFYFIATIDWPV